MDPSFDQSMVTVTIDDDVEVVPDETVNVSIESDDDGEINDEQGSVVSFATMVEEKSSGKTTIKHNLEDPLATPEESNEKLLEAVSIKAEAEADVNRYVLPYLQSLMPVKVNNSNNIEYINEEEVIEEQVPYDDTGEYRVMENDNIGAILHTCPECSFVAPERNGYLQHLRDVHRITLHECPYCPSKYLHEEFLVSHIRQIHFRLLKLTCCYCRVSFDNYTQLRTHLGTDHGFSRATPVENVDFEFLQESVSEHFRRDDASQSDAAVGSEPDGGRLETVADVSTLKQLDKPSSNEKQPESASGDKKQCDSVDRNKRRLEGSTRDENLPGAVKFGEQVVDQSEAYKPERGPNMSLHRKHTERKANSKLRKTPVKDFINANFLLENFLHSNKQTKNLEIMDKQCSNKQGEQSKTADRDKKQQKDREKQENPDDTSQFSNVPRSDTLLDDLPRYNQLVVMKNAKQSYKQLKTFGGQFDNEVGKRVDKLFDGIGISVKHNENMYTNSREVDNSAGDEKPENLSQNPSYSNEDFEKIVGRISARHLETTVGNSVKNVFDKSKETKNEHKTIPQNTIVSDGKKDKSKVNNMELLESISADYHRKLNSMNDNSRNMLENSSYVVGKPVENADNTKKILENILVEQCHEFTDVNKRETVLDNLLSYLRLLETRPAFKEQIPNSHDSDKKCEGIVEPNPNVTIKSKSQEQNVPEQEHKSIGGNKSPGRDGSSVSPKKKMARTNHHHCYVCSSVFLRENELIDHTRAEHVDFQSLQCLICKNSFGFFRTLKRHFYYHHEIMNFKLNRDFKFVLKTSKTSRSRRNLSHDESRIKIDVNSVTGKKTRTNNQQGAKAMQSRSVAVDVNTVTVDAAPGKPDLVTSTTDVQGENRIKQFLCSSCTFKTRRRKKLKRHMKEVHKIKPSHKCSYCEKLYSTIAELTSHLQSFHRYSESLLCLSCNRKFKYMKILEEHVRDRHGNTGKPLADVDFKIVEEISNCADSKDGKQRYTYRCRRCNFKSNTKGKMMMHIKVHKRSANSKRNVRKDTRNVKAKESATVDKNSVSCDHTYFSPTKRAVDLLKISRKIQRRPSVMRTGLLECEKRTVFIAKPFGTCREGSWNDKPQDIGDKLRAPGDVSVQITSEIVDIPLTQDYNMLVECPEHACSFTTVTGPSEIKLEHNLPITVTSLQQIETSDVECKNIEHSHVLHERSGSKITDTSSQQKETSDVECDKAIYSHVLNERSGSKIKDTLLQQIETLDVSEKAGHSHVANERSSSEITDTSLQQIEPSDVECKRVGGTRVLDEGSGSKITDTSLQKLETIDVVSKNAEQSQETSDVEHNEPGSSEEVNKRSGSEITDTSLQQIEPPDVECKVRHSHVLNEKSPSKITNTSLQQIETSDVVSKKARQSHVHNESSDSKITDALFQQKKTLDVEYKKAGCSHMVNERSGSEITDASSQEVETSDVECKVTRSHVNVNEKSPSKITDTSLRQTETPDVVNKRTRRSHRHSKKSGSKMMDPLLHKKKTLDVEYKKAQRSHVVSDRSGSEIMDTLLQEKETSYVNCRARRSNVLNEINATKILDIPLQQIETSNIVGKKARHSHVHNKRSDSKITDASFQQIETLDVVGKNTTRSHVHNERSGSKITDASLQQIETLDVVGKNTTRSHVPNEISGSKITDASFQQIETSDVVGKNTTHSHAHNERSGSKITDASFQQTETSDVVGKNTTRSHVHNERSGSEITDASLQQIETLDVVGKNTSRSHVHNERSGSKITDASLQQIETLGVVGKNTTRSHVHNERSGSKITDASLQQIETLDVVGKKTTRSHVHNEKSGSKITDTSLQQKETLDVVGKKARHPHVLNEKSDSKITDTSLHQKDTSDIGCKKGGRSHVVKKRSSSKITNASIHQKQTSDIMRHKARCSHVVNERSGSKVIDTLLQQIETSDGDGKRVGGSHVLDEKSGSKITGTSLQQIETSDVECKIIGTSHMIDEKSGSKMTDTSLQQIETTNVECKATHSHVLKERCASKITDKSVQQIESSDVVCKKVGGSDVVNERSGSEITDGSLQQKETSDLQCEKAGSSQGLNERCASKITDTLLQQIETSDVGSKKARRSHMLNEISGVKTTNTSMQQIETSDVEYKKVQLARVPNTRSSSKMKDTSLQQIETSNVVSKRARRSRGVNERKRAKITDTSLQQIETLNVVGKKTSRSGMLNNRRPSKITNTSLQHIETSGVVGRKARRSYVLNERSRSTITGKSLQQIETSNLVSKRSRRSLVVNERSDPKTTETSLQQIETSDVVRKRTRRSHVLEAGTDPKITDTLLQQTESSGVVSKRARRSHVSNARGGSKIASANASDVGRKSDIQKNTAAKGSKCDSDSRMDSQQLLHTDPISKDSLNQTRSQKSNETVRGEKRKSNRRHVVLKRLKLEGLRSGESTAYKYDIGKNVDTFKAANKESDQIEAKDNKNTDSILATSCSDIDGRNSIERVNDQLLKIEGVESTNVVCPSHTSDVASEDVMPTNVITEDIDSLQETKSRQTSVEPINGNQQTATEFAGINSEISQAIITKPIGDEERNSKSVIVEKICQEECDHDVIAITNSLPPANLNENNTKIDSMVSNAIIAGPHTTFEESNSKNVIVERIYQEEFNGDFIVITDSPISTVNPNEDSIEVFEDELSSNIHKAHVESDNMTIDNLLINTPEEISKGDNYDVTSEMISRETSNTSEEVEKLSGITKNQEIITDTDDNDIIFIDTYVDNERNIKNIEIVEENNVEEETLQGHESEKTDDVIKVKTEVLVNSKERIATSLDALGNIGTFGDKMNKDDRFPTACNLQPIIQNNSAADVNVVFETEPPFECFQCSSKYERKANLIMHIENVHPGSVVKLVFQPKEEVELINNITSSGSRKIAASKLIRVLSDVSLTTTKSVDGSLQFVDNSSEMLGDENTEISNSLPPTSLESESVKQTHDSVKLGRHEVAYHRSKYIADRELNFVHDPKMLNLKAHTDMNQAAPSDRRVRRKKKKSRSHKVTSVDPKLVEMPDADSHDFAEEVLQASADKNEEQISQKVFYTGRLVNVAGPIAVASKTIYTVPQSKKVNPIIPFPKTMKHTHDRDSVNVKIHDRKRVADCTGTVKTTLSQTGKSCGIEKSPVRCQCHLLRPTAKENFSHMREAHVTEPSVSCSYCQSQQPSTEDTARSTPDDMLQCRYCPMQVSSILDYWEHAANNHKDQVRQEITKENDQGAADDESQNTESCVLFEESEVNVGNQPQRVGVFETSELVPQPVDQQQRTTSDILGDQMTEFPIVPAVVVRPPPYAPPIRPRKPTIFRCGLCRYRSGLRSELHLHLMRAHEGQPSPARCAFCEYEGLPDEVLAHTARTHHAGCALGDCSVCLFKRQWMIRLSVAKFGDEAQMPARCAECGWLMASRAMLRSHTDLFHGDGGPGVHACLQCDRDLGDEQAFVAHLRRRHCSRNVYNCGQCSFETTDGLRLTDHVRVVHDDVFCTACEPREPYQGRKRRVCECITLHKSPNPNWWPPKETGREGDPEESAAEMEQRLCGECGWMFASSTDLESHMVQHDTTEEPKHEPQLSELQQLQNQPTPTIDC